MSQPPSKAKRTVSSRQRLLAKLHKGTDTNAGSVTSNSSALPCGLFRGVKPITFAVKGDPYSRYTKDSQKYTKLSRAEKTRRKFIAAAD